jgi:sarcosine oxidase
VVRTATGAVEARAAVVTAGPWARELLRRTRSSVPLTPILQTVTYFTPREARANAFPTFIEWGSPELVWYALDGVGEAPGLKIGAHVGGTPVDPNDGPFDPEDALIEMQSEYVRRRFPGLDPDPVRADTCLYTMTPDEDVVLDRMGPVIVGAGFSGHGFKFGPLIGEMLADLVTGKDPGLPGRFSSARAQLLAG